MPTLLLHGPWFRRMSTAGSPTEWVAVPSAGMRFQKRRRSPLRTASGYEGAAFSVRKMFHSVL